jgi:ankyrin repeat protein
MLQKDGLVVSKLYENVDKEEKFEASFELEIEDLEAHANLMYECAAEGDLECLNELLDEGKVDVNQVDIDGFTALMIASAEGHRDIVLELLRRGADVSLRTHELRTTALHFAAKVQTIVRAFIVLISFSFCQPERRHYHSK